MTIYDDYPLLVPTYRYSTGAPGERPDIQHRWQDATITRQTVPAPPRFKAEAVRLAWGRDGESEVKLTQVLHLACPKCFTKQTLCADFHYAPALLRNGIFSKEERELALAEAVDSLGRDNDSLRRSYNRAEAELAQRRPIPHAGLRWCATFDLLDGKDDL